MKNLTKIVVLVQIIDELSDGLIDGPLSAKINTGQHSSFLLVEGTHILIGQRSMESLFSHARKKF